ncbi:MAG: hypothetical protein HPAVJP_4600 [Candidatus Hepatoplasma vulgare]|nr:MAG: hypothetical protein HPAVJP_4600 [Candidatus Hepatoplasma sp.]
MWFLKYLGIFFFFIGIGLCAGWNIYDIASYAKYAGDPSILSSEQIVKLSAWCAIELSSLLFILFSIFKFIYGPDIKKSN